jgi:hypothetical protein
LTFDPDTTSGRSYRHNQHADRITMPVVRDGTSRDNRRDHKIDPRPS